MKPYTEILQRVATALLVVAGLATTIATSPPPCQKHGDCESGESCLEAGYCAQPCESDDDCLGSEHCSEEGSCEWGCEDDENCTVTCEEIGLCAFDAEGSALLEHGSAEIDVTMSQHLFYTERTDQIRGTLRLLAYGTHAGQDTTWRLTMDPWGVEKDVDLRLGGAEIVALDFGLDPADEPCSIGEACLLQFRLEQTGGPAGGSVDMVASVTIALTAPAGFETHVEVLVTDVR